MKYVDLGKSFNHFKKQFTMEKEITGINKQYYNLGVEKCLNFCRSQVTFYRTINERGNEWRAIEAIVKTLEYFKKPLSPQNDDYRNDETYSGYNQNDIADIP